jgi:hypothetical protein
MIVLVFAGLVGGIVTAILAAPIGLLAAFCAAPFGGSLLAVVAGLVIASRRDSASQGAYATTDEQVAALRSVLATAYPAGQVQSSTQTNRAA